MRGFGGAIRPTLNFLIGYAPAPQLSVGYMDYPKLILLPLIGTKINS